jgi:hypothetical protein
MNPLIADIHDLQNAITIRNAMQDKKIEEVKKIAAQLSEMAIQNNDCFEALQSALAIMCRIKNKHRIVSLHNLQIEKH